MSPVLRRAIYVVCTLLWASGCVWLVVHFFFPATTDFGPAPSPWEPVFLRIHGWVAVCTVFLLGWITAEHISDRWRRSRNRVTGLSLAGFALVLVLSGYALYYTTDYFHDVAAVAHEALGMAAIIIALLHWTRSSSNQKEGGRV